MKDTEVRVGLLALHRRAIANRYADVLSNLIVYPMKHAAAYFYWRLRGNTIELYM